MFENAEATRWTDFTNSSVPAGDGDVLKPPFEAVPPADLLLPPFDPAECDHDELAAWGDAEAAEHSVGSAREDDGPDGPGAGNGLVAVDDLTDAYGLDLVQAGFAVLAELEAAEAAVDGLDRAGTLERVAGGQQRVRAALSEQLELVAHWADLNAVVETPTVGPGVERLVQLGGDGTPQVAEFAVTELAVLLAVSDRTADGLVADALDLRHRLPRLWSRVTIGDVDVWTARKVADRTRHLAAAAAAAVDARLSSKAGFLTWRRLTPVLDAAIVAADPATARSAADTAAADTGAWVNEESHHGHATMVIRAAATDVTAFDQALTLVARALRILGDVRPRDRRRATAVGILASPDTAQQVVDLAERVRQHRLDAQRARRSGDHHEADRLDALAAELTATWTGRAPAAPDQPAKVDRRPCTFSSAVLYYHLTADTLTALLGGEDPGAGAGLVRWEGVGPVLLDQVRGWLQHANVVVRPVLDLAGVTPVDRYEVTPTISEAIRLRHPADYSPFATSQSRHQDRDHTVTYRAMTDGGPPGQTSPTTMALLSRGRHRWKTHSGATVEQIGPLAWLWRTRHGYTYLVNPHGTTPLGRL